MKSVALHNLGCKVNSYELDVVQQKMTEIGFKIVPFDQNADIYIINTCTVTNIADRKSRQMLHQAKKRNPQAIVVAMGCYVQTGEEQLRMDECIDIAIGNNQKKDAADIICAYLQQRDEIGRLSGAAPLSVSDRAHPLEEHIIDINHTDEYEQMRLEQTGEHTRAYIKIQDGCNQFCSYCIIPFARGRVRSRRTEDIIEEIQGLVEKGYQEFVLTGIHISSYGVDFDGESYNYGTSHLPQLIKQIHDLDGVKRLRLGSLEPRIVTEEFARMLAELPKVCPHFHLSLQSGCDETLTRMNRKYTTAEFKESVMLLRRYLSHPAITTDVIVGFPGETEEEFEKTKSFLETISFFEMHIFPYSVRKGTVAAGLKNQVDGEIKKRRSRILLELEQRQSLAYRQSFVGAREEVLFEENKSINGISYELGHTTRYVRVAKKTEENLSNRMIKGRLAGMLCDDIVLME